MTTYFTPVGTLPELTRAKGSDINARESAVTTGFTGIEAALLPVSGTSSISYGNWTDFFTQSRLKKSNTLVQLNLAVTAGASGLSPIVTLPAGYRPPAAIQGIAGVAYQASSTNYRTAVFSISSSGVVDGNFITETTLISFAVGDVAFINVSFFNA